MVFDRVRLLLEGIGEVFYSKLQAWALRVNEFLSKT